MKILQVISGNDNGGGAKHVLNICAYSEKKIINEIAFIGTGIFYDTVKNSNIKCECFEVNIQNKEFVKFVNENKYDIVDFHGAKAFFLYFLTSERIDCPCVATVHSDYNKDFLNNKFKNLLYTPLSRMGLSKFNDIVCVSDFIKELLINDKIKSNYYVINNGIDFEKIHPIKMKDEVRHELNINTNDFVFVCTARMHPVKNHKRLLAAFEKLNNEYKNTKLLFIGDGEEEQNLIRQACECNIQESVIFIGYKENTFDYVNAGDVSILVSLSEGGSPPLVVLESAALKIPVIFSNIGNIKKNFEDKMYITNQYSTDDIYLNMRKAYANRDGLKNQVEMLYDYCKDKYSVRNFCDNYYKVYIDIIKQQKRREEHA